MGHDVEFDRKDSSKGNMDETAIIEKRKEKLDRNFALAISTLLILIAVFLIVIDLKTLELTNDMRILGPGAFPLIIFGILIVLNIWYMVEVITGKGGSAKLGAHIEFSKMKKGLRLFFLIIIGILLTNLIGFVLAMMIFTFCEMKFLSEKKVKLYKIILSTILLPLSVYFIFQSLQVSLPAPTWMPF